MGGPGNSGAKEPGAPPDASSDMSAQMHPGTAPSMPLATPPATMTGSGAGTDAAFDRWLRQELSRLYDSALSEPVPPELLRLLQDDEKA